MTFQRLFLVPEMFWIGRFGLGLLLFCWMWIKSRRLLRIAVAVPAIALTIAFAWAVTASHFSRQDPAILIRYLTLAREAVVEDNVKKARLLFRRAQQMAPGDHSITLELASALFDLGERSESYQMLASIAPIQKSGYLPAHRFLAQHPPELPSVQQDYFRAVHLSHLVRNSAETRIERVDLLRLLAQYRKLNDIETIIREALDRYPEDRLFLAQLKHRNGDQSGARKEAEEACRTLSVLVQQNPGNLDRRIHLAQGYVFLAKFVDAICIMSEGLSRSELALRDLSVDNGLSTNQPRTNTGTPAEHGLQPSFPDDRHKLASVLGNIYFAWLATLPANEHAIQLQCLQRMLTRNSNVLSGSDAESPAELNVKLQTALTSPEQAWVLAGIEGNARVARGEWSTAEEMYRVALKSAPDDPAMSNNLAWLLLRKARADAADDAQQPILEEALQWSEKSVVQMPEIVNFLETRGQIHAELGNHAEALSDLTKCLQYGKDSPEIQRSVEACTRALR